MLAPGRTRETSMGYPDSWGLPWSAFWNPLGVPGVLGGPRGAVGGFLGGSSGEFLALVSHIGISFIHKYVYMYTEYIYRCMYIYIYT